MAAIARSFIRPSASIRNAVASAVKLTTDAKAGRSSSFRFPSAPKPSCPSRFLLRSPVEMSCCVESLMPLHTATSSAVLTSLLSVSRRPGFSWVSEGQDETR